MPAIAPENKLDFSPIPAPGSRLRRYKMEKNGDILRGGFFRAKNRKDLRAQAVDKLCLYCNLFVWVKSKEYWKRLRSYH